MEKALQWSKSYKEFAQDNQGYSALRYTVNATLAPCPIGMIKKGAAEIYVDDSVQKIAGTMAKGGEGAYAFEAQGKLLLSAQFRAYNEQNTDNAVYFEFKNLTTGDVISSYSATIKAKAQNVLYTIPAFETDVQVGDKIGINFKSDKQDGFYLQSNSANEPLLQVTMTLEEIK